MRNTYILIFILLLNCKSFSQPIIYKGNTKIGIGGRVNIIEDKKNKYTLKQILNNYSSKSTNAQIPNLGLTESAFWLKYKIINQSSSSRLILKINQPLLDEVVFYSIKGNTKIKELKNGEFESFYERKYDYPAYSYDLDLDIGDTGTYVLKIMSKEPIMLDISLSPEDVVWDEEMENEIFLGIYIGIIIVMALYNLFIFLTVLDVSYLIYVAYIALVGLAQISVKGYGYKYLWPEAYWFNDVSIVLFSSLGAIAAIEFMKIFLKTKEHVPILSKIFLIFEFIFVISILLLFVKKNLLAFSLVQLTTLLLSFYILYVAVKILLKGFRPAIFFLLAWIVLLVAAFIFIIKDFGLLPYNFFTIYSMQIGSGLEVILLSFALADRIKILHKEKEISQFQTLQVLRENEQIITDQNILLENKVEKRTLALTKSNNELSNILFELKQTQSQLVNAEKMASLGQLTAGIAHEINNPINFVVSNVKPLRRDIEDIQKLVQKYEDANLASVINERIKEVNDFRKEIDYDYVKEEISNLLTGIEEGALRTADIVRGLRVFSRLDENDLKKINITDGIESTLTLLNSEISNTITIVKNYADIPKIECYPGKMNQVFMNILNNAIFAIKENKERKEKGSLIITASSNVEFVKISISDNGLGMSKAVKAKVFEPFFTTKDVGKGTGLGMSITFSIIQDHKGTIEVNTEHGKGTEFIITLPINQVFSN